MAVPIFGSVVNAMNAYFQARITRTASTNYYFPSNIGGANAPAFYTAGTTGICGAYLVGNVPTGFSNQNARSPVDLGRFVINVTTKKISELYTATSFGSLWIPRLENYTGVAPNMNVTGAGAWGAWYESRKNNIVITGVELWYNPPGTEVRTLYRTITNSNISQGAIVVFHNVPKMVYYRREETPTTMDISAGSAHYNPYFQIVSGSRGTYGNAYFQQLTALDTILDGVNYFMAVAGTGTPVASTQGTLIIPIGDAGDSEEDSYDKLVDTLQNNGIPFVINDPDLAQRGDPWDFPDYENPGQKPNQTGGGDGDGDNSSDPMEQIQNVDLSPSSVGCDLWAMDGNELLNVAQTIWDPVITEGRDLSPVWVNCMYFPFDVVTHDGAHTPLATVHVADITTQLQSHKISAGYNRIFDVGTFDMSEYYGSFLDYAPYTKITIYLGAYLGYYELPTNKFMNKTIHIRYAVDFVAGLITAFIQTDDIGGQTETLAQFSGKIGIPVAITGTNRNTAIAETVTSALSLATTVGASIPLVMGGSALGLTYTAGSIIGNAEKLSQAQHGQQVQIGHAGAETMLNAPQGVYLIIERPRTATAGNFVELNGWQTNYTDTVSAFTGFLQCSNVVNTVVATDEEKKQITDLLAGGIYI